MRRDAINRRQFMGIYACMRCALCSTLCPTFTSSGSVLVSPSFRLKTLKRLVEGRGGLTSELCREVFRCTMCGRCREACYFSINTVDLWYLLRHCIHRANMLTEGLKKLEESLVSFKNPYGSDPSLRVEWVEMAGLSGLVDLEPKKADVVLFMGCTSAYRSVNQYNLAAAMLLLNKVRESWALLGEGEWCCGCPLLLLGNSEAAVNFAKHNVEAIEALRARKLVTTCASCYKVFKLKYEGLIGRPLPFKVLHITELLARCMAELRLWPTSRMKAKVVYHDPCDLARGAGVMKAPRLVLAEVSERVVEFPERGFDTQCCGGGGLLQVVDNELRLKIGMDRVKEALDLKADVLASACPACKQTFVEAAREKGLDVEILDVTEVVARAMGLT